MASENRDFDEFLEKFRNHHDLMVRELHKVIIGQDHVIEQILTAIFTGGHCLLVGVPGLAKTLIVSTIARILDVDFRRIQFTPDLMPSDITGTSVLEESDTGRREFRFVKGPVFTSILLADEINRTPPKTQAALLQAMQEREVTAGQQTWTLPEPFFVIATQNPIEQEGTYPLPEAQLDRFMFNVKVEYPTLDEEEQVLSSTSSGEKPEIRKVLSARSILYLQRQIRQIEVAPLTVNYVARLVRATRPSDDSAPDFVKQLVDWGAGPRAGQYLIAGARSLAAMDGRPSISLDDVRRVAIPVLRHRISTNFQAQAEGLTTEDLIERLLKSVPEPDIARYEQRQLVPAPARKKSRSRRITRRDFPEISCPVQNPHGNPRTGESTARCIVLPAGSAGTAKREHGRMRTGRFTSPGPWTGLLAVCMACGALSTATAAEKAAKYALLVGVTKYEHSRMNDAPLKFPEADAKSVGELLRASGYTVRLLLGKAATREAILRELKLLARQGAHDGAVVVGLFGHGVQYGDDAFFGPFDTGIRQSTDAAGQVILNSRGQVRFEPDSRTMVNMEAILIALRACGAGNRVLLADCCRNDPAAARGRAFGSSLKMANLRSGTAALFACSAGERAFEHDDWQHGAFTKALLDHAAHLAARGNVLAGSLSERIHRSVADMVKARTKGRFSQTVNPLVNGIVDLKLVAATRRPATPQPPPFRPRPVSRKPAETVASIRGMQLKLIPAGSFQMGSGSTSKELARRFSTRAEYFASEFPRHHVKITRPFYMGVHEVTQGQWQDVMGTAPWRNKELVQAHENNPAVYVSWTDAREFCQKLSLRDGATYRLPTEAEWEYACRAGSSTLYSFGDDQQQLDRHAWFRRNADDAGKAFAHPVGVRQPNDWGLFDMHGNVWEWCQDRFDEKYYRQFATRVAVDPQGPFGRSSGRVYRGGCWFGSPQGCRASNRAGDSPGLRFNYLGFRIVREVPNTAPDFVRRNTEPGSTGR